MILHTKEAKRRVKIWNWAAFLLAIVSAILLIAINRMKL
jgi:hypothetical protein